MTATDLVVRAPAELGDDSDQWVARGRELLEKAVHVEELHHLHAVASSAALFGRLTQREGAHEAASELVILAKAAIGRAVVEGQRTGEVAKRGSKRVKGVDGRFTDTTSLVVSVPSPEEAMHAVGATATQYRVLGAASAEQVDEAIAEVRAEGKGLNATAVTKAVKVKLPPSKPKPSPRTHRRTLPAVAPAIKPYHLHADQERAINNARQRLREAVEQLTPVGDTTVEQYRERADKAHDAVTKGAAYVATFQSLVKE